MCRGATKPSFRDPSQVKKNSNRSHLKGTLFPTCNLLFAVEKYFFYARWGEFSYCQYYTRVLKETFGHHFIQKDELPPNSADCNPLNYFLGTKSNVNFMRVKELQPRRFFNLTLEAPITQNDRTTQTIHRQN